MLVVAWPIRRSVVSTAILAVGVVIAFTAAGAWSSAPGAVIAADREEVGARLPLYRADIGAWLIKKDGEVLVLSEKSPYGGRALVFCRSSHTFIGTHFEQFEPDGTYIGGPSPRNMDRMESEVRDGKVYVWPHRVTDGGPRVIRDLPDVFHGPLCLDILPGDRGYAYDP